LQRRANDRSAPTRLAASEQTFLIAAILIALVVGSS
jgi:hypothetical protein